MPLFGSWQERDDNKLERDGDNVQQKSPARRKRARL